MTSLIMTQLISFRDRSESSQQSGSHSRSLSRHSQDTPSQSLSDDTRIDTLSGASSCPSGVNVKDLLYEAYRWIGDPDGVYGCGAGRQADAMSRLLHKSFFFSLSHDANGGAEGHLHKYL